MARIIFFAYHLKSLLNHFERLIVLYRSPSRRERLEMQLLTAAESGEFTIDSKLKLYKSEIKRLKRDGFSVMPEADSNKPVYCKISWYSPFKEGIPHLVYSYITNLIDTPPKNLNFAQELFVIASRKNNE